MSEEKIKQEIEQVGYKEFYRYYKEKDILINKQKEVLDKIKEYIKESIECSKGVLSNPEHTIVGKHELIKLEIENYKKILELLEKNNE